MTSFIVWRLTSPTAGRNTGNASQREQYLVRLFRHSSFFFACQATTKLITDKSYNAIHIAFGLLEGRKRTPRPGSVSVADFFFFEKFRRLYFPYVCLYASNFLRHTHRILVTFTFALYSRNTWYDRVLGECMLQHFNKTEIRATFDVTFACRFFTLFCFLLTLYIR